MMYAKRTLGFFLFCMAGLCLPVPAMAATVNFSSGSYNNVVGNPYAADDANGIGGISSLPTNNPNGSGNTVNVTGGAVNSGIYGGVHQTNTSAYANATGNTVNVASPFAGSTYLTGGHAQVQGPAGIRAAATDNSVNINGGSFSQVFGGYALTAGGSAAADNNTVHLASGTVTTLLYGGYANGSAASDLVTSASGNHVIISGGTVTGTVYGGWANSGTNRQAAGNTVTLLGHPDLSAVRIYGGYIGNAAAPAGSGNTLEVKTAGITANQINGFQNLHFFLPDSAGDQDIVLAITGTAYIGGATVYVGMSGNNSPLQIGDTVTLIQGTLNGTPANNGGRGAQGISKIYTFQIDADNSAGKLLATVLGIEEAGDGGQVDAQLKSLDESRMAGLALLTQGQDLLENRAIPQLRRKAPHTPSPVAFGVMGGNVLRYTTGSHVDVKSFNLLAGFGWNAAPHNGGKGNALLGVFFETGQGDYDTRNAFNSIAIKGHGNTHYYGGGILARYDSAPLNGAGFSGNFYLETALRAGRVDTRYKSSDIMTASFDDVDFDSSAAYYGLHAGIGYIWNITEASSLDIYTKYLWTRQDGDYVTVEGDSIHFKSVDSRRWRSGVRFSHALRTDSGRIFTPYVGAAYEHEFDSKARSASNGRAVPVPDVEGATGMGEFGFRFSPSATSGFSLDIGVQGYAGKREGGGGSVLAMWEF